MRTQRMCRTVLAAAVLTAVSAPLYAQGDQTAADKPNPAFQKLDVNRDGYVSRDEAGKLRDFNQLFNDADRDRDGRLNQAEFDQAQGKYDTQRTKAYLSDSMITAKVKAAFVKDKQVSALAVSVTTDKGTVLLSGFVENEQQARRAQEIAAATEGVKSVKSNLVVKS